MNKHITENTDHDTKLSVSSSSSWCFFHVIWKRTNKNEDKRAFCRIHISYFLFRHKKKNHVNAPVLRFKVCYKSSQFQGSKIPFHSMNRIKIWSSQLTLWNSLFNLGSFSFPHVLRWDNDKPLLQHLDPHVFGVPVLYLKSSPSLKLWTVCYNHTVIGWLVNKLVSF